MTSNGSWMKLSSVYNEITNANERLVVLGRAFTRHGGAVPVYVEATMPLDFSIRDRSSGLFHGSMECHLQKIVLEGLRPGGKDPRGKHSVFASLFHHDDRVPRKGQVYPYELSTIRHNSDIMIVLDSRVSEDFEWWVTAAGTAETNEIIPWYYIARVIWIPLFRSSNKEAVIT